MVRIFQFLLCEQRVTSIAIGSLNNEESTYDFDLISKFMVEFLYTFEILEVENSRTEADIDTEDVLFTDIRLCCLMRHQARIFTSRLYEIDVLKTRKRKLGSAPSFDRRDLLMPSSGFSA